jgi:hypothetical protein
MLEVLASGALKKNQSALTPKHGETQNSRPEAWPGRPGSVSDRKGERAGHFPIFSICLTFSSRSNTIRFIKDASYSAESKKLTCAMKLLGKYAASSFAALVLA